MKVYRNLGFTLHYTMSFIGGSMEVVSFVYFYQALIGYMTSNMVFGVVSLWRKDFTFNSVFHMLVLLIWVVIATLYELFYGLHEKQIRKINEARLYFICLCVNLILLLIFIISGHFLFSHGRLGATPQPMALSMVTIGLIFMFIHNFVIKHGSSKYPASTSAVTGTYVNLSKFFASYLILTKQWLSHDPHIRKRDVVIEYHKFRHYFLVLFHIFLGASVTFLLLKFLDFYALGLSLLLIIFMMKKTYDLS